MARSGIADQAVVVTGVAWGPGEPPARRPAAGADTGLVEAGGTAAAAVTGLVGGSSAESAAFDK
jgi:hypothetical protein